MGWKMFSPDHCFSLLEIEPWNFQTLVHCRVSVTRQWTGDHMATRNLWACLVVRTFNIRKYNCPIYVDFEAVDITFLAESDFVSWDGSDIWGRCETLLFVQFKPYGQPLRLAGEIVKNALGVFFLTYCRWMSVKKYRPSEGLTVALYWAWLYG